MFGYVRTHAPELRLREHMDVRHENVLTAIRTTGKLEPETEEQLKLAIEALLADFLAV